MWLRYISCFIGGIAAAFLVTGAGLPDEVRRESLSANGDACDAVVAEAGERVLPSPASGLARLLPVPASIQHAPEFTQVTELRETEEVDVPQNLASGEPLADQFVLAFEQAVVQIPERLIAAELYDVSVVSAYCEVDECIVETVVSASEADNPILMAAVAMPDAHMFVSGTLVEGRQSMTFRYRPVLQEL